MKKHMGDLAAPSTEPASPRLGSNRVPATPLPWRIFARRNTLEISPPEPSGLGERPAVVFWQGFDGNGFTKRENSINAAYIVHACNAYPMLVDALAIALNRATLNHYGDDPIRECAHIAALARSLLRQLGELS